METKSAHKQAAFNSENNNSRNSNNKFNSRMFKLTKQQSKVTAQLVKSPDIPREFQIKLKIGNKFNNWLISMSLRLTPIFLILHLQNPKMANSLNIAQDILSEMLQQQKP